MNSYFLQPNQGQLLDAIFNKIEESFQRMQRYSIVQKEVLTVEEAAIYTGLSKSYLYKLTSTNKIPFYKPNNKMCYFNRKELEGWLLQNRNRTIEEIEADANAYLLKSEINKHSKLSKSVKND